MQDATHHSTEEKVEIVSKEVELDEEEKKLEIESVGAESAQVGVWRVVGGRRMSCVDVVTLCKRAVGEEQVSGMAEAVIKVRTLLQANRREWDVTGKAWGLHGQSEVLWMASNTKVEVEVNVVRETLVMNVRALWGKDA